MFCEFSNINMLPLYSALHSLAVVLVNLLTCFEPWLLICKMETVIPASENSCEVKTRPNCSTDIIPFLPLSPISSLPFSSGRCKWSFACCPNTPNTQWSKTLVLAKPGRRRSKPQTQADGHQACSSLRGPSAEPPPHVLVGTVATVTFLALTIANLPDNRSPVQADNLLRRL